MRKVTSSKRHVLFTKAQHNPMGTAFSGHWFVYLHGVLIYASLFLSTVPCQQQGVSPIVLALPVTVLASVPDVVDSKFGRATD
jgi:hypothetical protein